MKKFGLLLFILTLSLGLHAQNAAQAKRFLTRQQPL